MCVCTCVYYICVQYISNSECVVHSCIAPFSFVEWCKVGLGICYDLRFPELALLYAKQGCKLLCYPAAFSKHTGPLHWDLLLRSRALDNYLFAAGVSVTRDESAEYVAWGHSTVVDPW